MGIFSSKKKTHVDTAVVRIIEDNQVPDSVITGSVNAIFSGKSIADEVIEAIENSPYRKFERMYRYARDGDYYYGLPNARVLSTDDGIDAIEAILYDLVGPQVVIDYAYFRPLNHVHFAWSYLTDTLGYVQGVNEISSLSAVVGHTVYLDDLVVVYDEAPASSEDAGAVGVWGGSPRFGFTPLRYSQLSAIIGSLVAVQSWEVGFENGIRIKYMWEVPAILDEDGEEVTPAEIMTDEMYISLAAYDFDTEYFQAKYHYSDGSNTQWRYFTYEPGSGHYPTLDNIYSLNYTNPGTYFPFAVFRREKMDRTASALEHTGEYLTTKKLLSYIDIDFKSFGDSINESPDIQHVEQAVLMMAVPMNTQEPVEIDYLMRYFTRLHGTTDLGPMVGSARLAQLASLSAGESPAYALEVADADFRVIISFDNVDVRTRGGSIGPIGTFTNTKEEVYSSGMALVSGGDARVLRYQLRAGLYQEIRVFNPKARYDIRAGHAVIGAGEDDSCLIPLDYDICRDMRILDREKLYFRSLRLVVNSLVVEKVRWYQRSIFKALLVVVAIVIVVVTGDLATAWQVITTAAAAGATVLFLTVMKAVTIFLVKGVVIGLVFKEIAGLLGPELTAIIAAAMLIYGSYKAFKAGSVVAGSSAETMLQTSTMLTQGAMAEMKDMYAKLEGDMAEFNLLAEAKMQELEDAQDELRQSVEINPFEFIGRQPLTIFGETPSNYLNRSIHAGNIGARGFEIVQNYVQISLTLPTLQDTLGGSFNAR